MKDDAIPEDVRIFILQNIDSVAQLEGLLLFHANPGTEWDPASLSQRLYIDRAEAADLMRLLAERGLLALAENRTHYKFLSRSRELGDMVSRVKEAYSRHLLPVTNLVHAKSRTRVQKFADAFIITKKEKE